MGTFRFCKGTAVKLILLPSINNRLNFELGAPNDIAFGCSFYKTLTKTFRAGLIYNTLSSKSHVVAIEMLVC